MLTVITIDTSLAGTRQMLVEIRNKLAVVDHVLHKTQNYNMHVLHNTQDLQDVLGPFPTYPDIFESVTFCFRIRLPYTRIRRIR